MNLIDIIKSGSSEDWKQAIEEGENPNELDSYGITPLAWILKMDNLDLFSLALETGADPLYPHRTGGSVFQDLLSQNKTSFIEILLSKKNLWSGSEHLLTRDKSGNTVFHSVIQSENEDVWEHTFDLLNLENVSLRNEEGRSVFLEAVVSGNSDFVTSLWESFPHVKFEKDGEGKNGLHLSSERNLIDILRFLLEHSFPLEEKDESGNTALFLAAEADATESLELLLKAGANLFVYGGEGESITRLFDREKFHHSFKVWKKELYQRLKSLDQEKDKIKWEEALLYLKTEKPLTQAELVGAKLSDSV